MSLKLQFFVADARHRQRSESGATVYSHNEGLWLAYDDMNSATFTSSKVLALTFAALGCLQACSPSSGDPDLGSGGTNQGSGGGEANTGGSVGSGGADVSMPGTGGAAATGGADLGTGGGGTTLPEGSVIFSEDFESAAVDTVPAGWDSFVSYVVNSNNSPGGQAFALADASKAHGGSQSLHVKGGQSPAMLTRPLPAGTNKIYMRAYVWLTNQLGQGVGRNHETLIGVRGTPGGANDEVRFGEIKGVIGTNEVPSDNISPKQDQWEMGPVIAGGEWNCIEVAFLGDTENHEVVGWNNGVEVHRVNDPNQWQNGTLEKFLDNKFQEFIIGWQSFSSYDNEIWFDDVVVATERVGCD